MLNCSKCFEVKDESNFYLAKATKRGYKTKCKKCISEEQRLARSPKLVGGVRCRMCGDVGYYKGTHTFLCVKHHRFNQMRVQAKRTNKYVPSYGELDDINNRQNGICDLCKIEMNWVVPGKHSQRANLITLQHDDGGTIRFLCQGCNSRHAHTFRDDIYTADPNTKPCRKCGAVKQLSDFYQKKDGGVRGYCKDCGNQQSTKWAKDNIDKSRRSAREYQRRKRKTTTS